MNIEKKLAYLQEAAMLEARTQANDITSQHKKMLRRVMEQHMDEARHQSEMRIRAEKISARQQQNMAVSKAQLELKQEYSRCQKELKIELFKEVEQKLQEFMKTAEYMKLLVDYINKAARYANGEEMVIYLNSTDSDKQEYLEEITGMKLTISMEDFVGGIRAVIHNRNILIDHAYKGAIEREFRSFVFRGGTGIG